MKMKIFKKILIIEFFICRRCADLFRKIQSVYVVKTFHESLLLIQKGLLIKFLFAADAQIYLENTIRLCCKDFS
jgi:hypothetical protein